jgi:hypothetical protein
MIESPAAVGNTRGAERPNGYARETSPFGAAPGPR